MTGQRTRRVAYSTFADAGRAIRQANFLAAFDHTAIVAWGAKAAGVSRSVVYHWRKTDPAFEARFTEAREIAMDLLEMEARRRAVDGWDEPVFWRGRQIGTVRRYSDRLLVLLLRRVRPEVFGGARAAPRARA